jgi:hypothetical protein
MARRFYNEQEPGLYEDQSGDLYYDPNTGEFVSASAESVAAPVDSAAAPAVVSGIGTPAMTPEFLQQLQQGAAAVGNAAKSGGLSALFAPGALSPLDPLYEYAKTAPILSLKGNTEYENLNFQPLPGTNYRLVVGGETIGAASSPEQVAALVDAANEISAQGGSAVDVRLQKEVQAATRTGEPITAFEDVYANKENNMGALETLIPLALSVMGGAALGPLIQGGQVAGSASALGAGLGSAAGSFAGNLAVGKNLKESLIKAGISGLTAGALKGVMPGGGSGLGPMPDIDYAGLNNIVFGGGAALPAAALEPLLTASAAKLGSAALPAVLGGLTGAAVPAALKPSQPASTQAEPTITVTQQAPTGDPSLSGIGGFTPEGIRYIASPDEVAGQTPAQQDEAPADEDIDVTGKRIGKATLPPASLPAAVVSDVVTKYKPPEPVESLIEKQAKKIDDAEAITVTAKPIPAPPGFSAALPGLAMTLPAMTAAQAISTTAATPPDKKGLTPLQKASAGLTLASALADAVGGDGGGGGPLDLGTGYTVPGAGSGIGRTRNVATFDPFTYGQKEGEFQFFNTGPASAPAPSRFSAEPIMQSTGGLLGALNNPIMLQNLQEAMAAEPAFNAAASTGMAEGGEVDDDMVSHLIAYRKGGGHMGPGKVKGIGSGQDDKIPAWLSDGEYVWSAQDVADLGDGSTDEGVRRLDKMRQMVRKGAGRKDVKKIAKPQRGIEDMLKAVGGAV